jgi:hypothetical protein
VYIRTEFFQRYYVHNVLEQTKNGLSSDNACFHSVQKFLFFLLLSETVKSKLYENIILAIALYEIEILSLILRDDHRLSVMPVRIFGPRKGETTASRANCIYALREGSRRSMQHVRGKYQTYKEM